MTRRPALAGLCLVLLLSLYSVGATTRPPSWDKDPSPEFLAELRADWFLPRPPSLLRHQGGVALSETPIDKCGTKTVWKESGRKMSGVGQFLGNLVSRKAITRYEPLRILGHGTQGVVILARDKLKERLVAIKEERPSSLAREIRLLQAVQNSGDIMKLEDVLMPKHIGSATSAFAVYERLVLPVDQMHRMWGGLVHSIPAEAMRRIAFNIVRGVHFLHTNGIVHLDLKPDNVMLDENCAPRIVDLGISKTMCDEEGREMTFKGFHLKHGSRAPEYSGRSSSDLHGMRLSADMAKASDLWSLGMVLLTALHGGDVFRHYRKATGSVFEWNIDLLASMLGRPSERALKKHYAKGVYHRLMSFSKKPTVSLEQAFPHVDRAALAMVERLMKMDPGGRASTRDVLMDPYFAPVRNAAFHEDALAENLVPDPRIPELIHSKRFSRLSPPVAAATVIYELALAHSPDAEHATQVVRNGTHASIMSELR